MMKQIAFPSRGQTVYGYAHIPEAQTPSPALVLCHGFTGSGYEGSRIFIDFAKQACAEGFYVLRMDFLGSGNSDLDFAEYTSLSGWTEDVLSAADFLMAEPAVDSERIGFLGISFGSGAALCAGKSGKFKAGAGWASVIYPEVTFRQILGTENWNYLLENKDSTITHIYSGARFSVKSRFVEDLTSISIVDAVKQYKNTSLLLLQGDQDDVINITHSEQLSKQVSCPVEYHLVEGEDHGFIHHLEENIETTLDFFRRNL